jgi:hypothetical protein
MRLRFGIIWEGPIIEATNLELISEYTSIKFSSSSSSSSLIAQLETKRRYYPHNLYQTNFQKYPLLLVTYKTYMKYIKPFILNQLKDLQSKNSNNGENNHRIVVVFNLQCFLYDVGKPIGGNLGMKSVVFDFVKNHFASTITEYTLCRFACISYLTNPKRGKNCENKKTRIQYTRECFFHFYGYQNLSEEDKKNETETLQRIYSCNGNREVHVILPNGGKLLYIS